MEDIRTQFPLMVVPPANPAPLAAILTCISDLRLLLGMPGVGPKMTFRTSLPSETPGMSISILR